MGASEEHSSNKKSQNERSNSEGSDSLEGLIDLLIDLQLTNKTNPSSHLPTSNTAENTTHKSNQLDDLIVEKTAKKIEPSPYRFQKMQIIFLNLHKSKRKNNLSLKPQKRRSIILIYLTYNKQLSA